MKKGDVVRTVSFVVLFCLGLIGFGKLEAAPLDHTVFIMDDQGQIIPVAGADPFAAVGTLLHLETTHLVSLGLGIVIGSSVLAPELNLGEITGIIVGVIVGDLLYRTVLAPEKGHSWFPEGIF